MMHYCKDKVCVYWNKSHMANIISFWLNICANVPFFWHGTSTASTSTPGRSPEWFAASGLCALGFSVSQGIPRLHTAKWDLQPCQCSRVSFHLILSSIKHRMETFEGKGLNNTNFSGGTELPSTKAVLILAL